MNDNTLLIILFLFVVTWIRQSLLFYKYFSDKESNTNIFKGKCKEQDDSKLTQMDNLIIK